MVNLLSKMKNTDLLYKPHFSRMLRHTIEPKKIGKKYIYRENGIQLNSYVRNLSNSYFTRPFLTLKLRMGNCKNMEDFIFKMVLIQLKME